MKFGSKQITKIINDEIHLRCTMCGQFKIPDKFHKDKRAVFGRRLGRKSWCKACYNNYHQNYRENHPERIKKAIKKYYFNHRELCRYRSRQWRLNNSQKATQCKKTWYLKIENKITECVYARLGQSLGGKIERKNIWKLLGYTLQDLIAHIEKQFEDGMSWANHGEWELDHIIPISFYHFKSPKDIEFKLCWRLENIRPLWASENKKKNNRILVG